MMDRRKFGLTAAGLGVGGLLFPQKVEAKSVEPMLRGLTDLEMAQKVAEFPQGPQSILQAQSREITIPWGPPFLRQIYKVCLRENYNPCNSRWTVDGVRIHNTVFSSEFDPWTAIIDIPLLLQVDMWLTSTRKPQRLWIVEYRRLAVGDGFGWFTLKDQS